LIAFCQNSSLKEYWIQTGKIDLGIDTFAIFTKDATVDILNTYNEVEMQNQLIRIMRNTNLELFRAFNVCEQRHKKQIEVEETYKHEILLANDRYEICEEDRKKLIKQLKVHKISGKIIPAIAIVAGIYIGKSL
jgi:predicted nucleotidyltransferase